MYPFGYGLTYTTFAYENYKVSLKDDRLLQMSPDAGSTGDTASDEVVQIYGSALESCVKKPICQLLDFVRVKNIAPGETETRRTGNPGGGASLLRCHQPQTDGRRRNV